MHGGALMALADTLGAACAYLNLPPGASTTTLESKTNFFRGCGTAASGASPAPCTRAEPRSSSRPTCTTGTTAAWRR